MTIHLVGVNHTDPNSEILVRETISNIQPNVIFLEVGDYRFERMKSDSKTKNIIELIKSRIIDLRPRGRVVHSVFSIRQLISMIITGTIPGNVDMIPALELGQEMGIEVIPIDMDQFRLMNKLGRSMFSLDALLSFNPRERIEFIHSFSINDATNSLEALEKLAYHIKQIIPARYSVLIEERNNLMVENIDQSMNRNDKAVVVIGALHVPGMTEQLEQRGYDIKVHL